TSSVRLSCEVGGPHLLVSSLGVMSGEMIHLPQRKVSAFAVNGSRTAMVMATAMRTLMARMVAPASPMSAPLPFARYTVAFAVHLHVRTILEEKHRFLARVHLGAVL